MPISSANHKALNFGHLPRSKGLSDESGRLEGGENSPRQADRSHSPRFSFAQYGVRLAIWPYHFPGKPGNLNLKRLESEMNKSLQTVNVPFTASNVKWPYHFF
jgi:hypothetical protein